MRAVSFGIGNITPPQQAREAIRLLKSIADSHEDTSACFGTVLSQQQSRYVWTAGTSGQNTPIYASPALRLLVQTTGHLSEKVPKRQRTEHEKRPRSVNTDEDNSPSKEQLPGPKNGRSEPESGLSGSEYDPPEPFDDSDSDK